MTESRSISRIFRQNIGQNTSSPTCCLVVTGNAASKSGMAIRSTNQCGTRPSGVRTSGWEGGATPGPVRLKRIVSGSERLHEGIERFSGLANAVRAPLSAPATALAERLAGSFSSISWPGAKSAAQCHRSGPRQEISRGAAAENVCEAKGVSTFGIFQIRCRFSRFNSCAKPVYSERDYDDAKFCQIENAGIDRGRPPGGPVRLPVAVRLRYSVKIDEAGDAKSGHGPMVPASRISRSSISTFLMSRVSS